MSVYTVVTENIVTWDDTNSLNWSSCRHVPPVSQPEVVSRTYLREGIAIGFEKFVTQRLRNEWRWYHSRDFGVRTTHILKKKSEIYIVCITGNFAPFASESSRKRFMFTATETQISCHRAWKLN